MNQQTGALPRLYSAIARETKDVSQAFRPRLFLGALCAKLLPDFTLCLLRRSAYRLAGCKIDRAVTILGRVNLLGSGDIARKLQIGAGSIVAQMRTFYAAAPTLGNAQFILTRMATLASPATTSCRVAFLRSFTIEPILPLLRASSLLHGLDVTTWVSDFNVYAQEMLTANSALYRFHPDVVVLAVQTRDLAPDLWQRFTDLTPADVESVLAQTIADLRAWILAFRSHSQANLILHGMEMPTWPSKGILDGHDADGQSEAIAKLNAAIHLLAREYPGVFILNYEGMVARYGRERWHDERKWLTMRMPIAADALNVLAHEYLRSTRCF